MLIFARWLLKVFKKEHAFLTRYERSHPHFLRYLAIDAVLSLAIVLAGFQVYESHSSSSERLTHAGDVAMSSGQLIDHLKKDKVRAYWLGPVRGVEYTINHELRGIADVMYLRAGADPSDDKEVVYEVKTYVSKKIWDDHTHTILAVSNTTTISVNKNVSIKINKSSMKGVIATFADKPEIVAIAYPTPQTLDSMIKDVESLTLVR